MGSFLQGQASTAVPSSSFGGQCESYQQAQSWTGNAYAPHEAYPHGAGIPDSMLEGAVGFETLDGRVVSERLVESRQEFIAGVPRDMFNSEDVANREAVRAVINRVAEGGVAVAGVRPIYMMEKIVEVPHVITREYETYVPKPEIMERLIEVPKTEIHERVVQLPPRVQYKEQIVEVPEVVVEERVVHVPKREIQERLIEVPKVRYVERLEYEDVIEYREVVVDKIVEVPEIEYRVREVEHLVPQTYIQEYYVDRYKEVPVTQIQEVERIEHVPVMVHQGYAPPAMPPPSGAAPVAAAVPAGNAPVQAGNSALGSASGLHVGSSFLVPRGTLPRGHMGPSEAQRALASSIGSGALPSPVGSDALLASLAARPGFNPFDSAAAYSGAFLGSPAQVPVPVQA